ncbi:MAG: hypothetical protein KA791_00350 [Flavobacteriales bacterium]|nr:hypothetical protein [Flavobacteriales bacterium]
MAILTGKTFIERRWALLILIALVFRALYVFYHIRECTPDTRIGTFAIYTGDTESYLLPIENYIEHGDYKPDYRLPGVGVPYWVFRSVLAPEAARDALVIFQWLLSGISVYLLALITLRWTGSTRTSIIVYILFLLSAYSSWFDPAISSDSLSVTVLIFQVYVFQLAMERQRVGLVILAGLLLTWLVFLRPVSAALVPVAAFLVWRKWNGDRALRAAILFLVPFAVIDGAWAVRNLRVNGQLNPLTNEGVMPVYVTDGRWWEVMKFMQCYGGDYIWWNPGTTMRWFGVWKGGGALDDEGRKAEPPPPYAYVPAYDQDSLQLVANDVRLLATGTLSHTDSLVTAASIASRLQRYSEAYKKGAPFNYHVMSRLRMLKNEIGQNGTESLLLRPFGALPAWEKGWKLLQVGLFLFSLVVGGLAMLLMRWVPGAEGTTFRAWVPWFTLFTILIYPFGFRMCEWRYLVMVFPLLLMMAVIVSEALWVRFGPSARRGT